MPKAAAEPRKAPERLLDLGEGLGLWRVHVDDLHEQALNAQVMPSDMFARLSTTIGRDNRLESLPFCAMADVADADEPYIEIVSGHHRVRSARAAGLFYVYILADETGLTADQIRAKQLAHNSIAGSSEDQLVARIYAQIGDVDARLEAFISNQVADTVPPPVRLPRMDLDLGYRSVTLVFLPHQADLFDAAIDQLINDKAVPVDTSEVALIDQSLFDMWQAATRRFGKEYNVRALTVVVSKLVDAACEYLGIEGRKPDDIDPEAWVPIADILKGSVVPPEAAQTIRNAVAKAAGTGKDKLAPKEHWKIIEQWARESLK